MQNFLLQNPNFLLQNSTKVFRMATVVNKLIVALFSTLGGDTTVNKQARAHVFYSISVAIMRSLYAYVMYNGSLDLFRALPCLHPTSWRCSWRSALYSVKNIFTLLRSAPFMESETAVGPSQRSY